MTLPGSIAHAFQDSNVIAHRKDEQGEGVLVKQYLRKPLTFKMMKYALLRFFGGKVPVEYRSPAQRRDFEEACLSLWQAKGFSVPGLIAVPPDFPGTWPVLGIAPVKGERLDAYLSDPGRQTADKLSAIGNVFSEMHRRHCMAIFERDHRLIHYDANLRNVIITEGRPVHIDFEMGHLSESIDKSAAREVKKFALQVLNHLDASMALQVIGLLVARYRIHHVVRRMVDEELKRPFWKIHSRRDEKRRKREPGRITKMHLAFALQRSLGARSPGKADGTGDHALARAIETSWDGKFYQSLDDADPRGRDMNHRYEVMGFPASFQDRSVLDIGCNIGRICVDARKRGAKRAVGIDHREDVVDAMNKHFREDGMDVSLFAFDINRGVEALESVIGPAPFDYVCALSIWSHVEQKNLWDIINRYCAGVCFFEDNAPSRIKSVDRLKAILEQNLDFSRIDFMGFTTDRGVRAVFRMVK